MPAEIADSDAESDVASPVPANAVMKEVPLPSSIDEHPFANIEFDQFLSPTQRISSAYDPCDVIASRSTTSTDRFLQDIAQSGIHTVHSTAKSHEVGGSSGKDPSAVPLNKAKRTLSEIEGFGPKTEHKPAKRSRTYESATPPKSGPNPYCFDTVRSHVDQDQYAITRRHAILDSNSISAELPVQPLVSPVSVGHSRSETKQQNTDRPHHQGRQSTTSFLESRLTNCFVTKSMTGGYNGINMDFRGAGIGLDASANPFGSLSQVSLDGDLDGSQTEKFASLFRHSQPASPDELAIDAADAPTALQSSHSKEKAKGTEDAVGRLVEHHNNEIDPVKLVPLGKKKHSRKSKNTQEPIDTSAQNVDDPDQILLEVGLHPSQEVYKPCSSRSRAGTMDSVNSHASQASQTSGTSSRKRKRSTITEPSDSRGRKHLSSELNLSDPAMIGAPKELYVPRPSKSRAKHVEEHHGDGSRAGGKEALLSVLEENPVQDPGPPSSKKERGRKKKVKRAKTSAAALLKSSEMYDEDDKDCIMLDEMPAKIRMKPLPEIKQVKRESKAGTESVEQSGNVLADCIAQNDGASTEVRISIDVPKLPRPDAPETAAVPARPEPKKRGRKPKKKPDIQEADVENEQPGESNRETSESTEIRPALVEKDPNSNIKTPPSETIPDLKGSSEEQPAPSPSPKRPVHSPLKSTSSRSSTPSTAPGGGSNNGFWIKPRVGLSRRTAIPSLLRKLDRTKEPPKLTERKEKLSKRQQEEEDRRRLEAEDAGEEYIERWAIRGKDGMLVEWDE